MTFFAKVLWAASVVLVAKSVELAQMDVITLEDGANLQMKVDYCTFSVNGPGGNLFSGTSRCFCYYDTGMTEWKCSVPGPTLVMRNGTSINIDFTNNLTGEEYDTGDYEATELQYPDVVNFHTHGLHVSPEEDDVFLHINPQVQIDLPFNIPADHYPGTHWYHTHIHGSTNLQVTGGAFGALAMEYMDNMLGVDEYWILLHWFYAVDNSLCDCDNPMAYEQYLSTNNDGAFAAESTCYSWCTYSDTARDLSGFTYDMNAPSATEYFLVNGQYQPFLTIPTDTYVRLRVLNGMGQYYAQVRLSAGCSNYLIGNDGIFFDTARDLDDPSYANEFILPPGARADIFVSCPEGLYNVEYSQTDLDPGIGGLARAPAGVRIFTINATSALTPSPSSVPASFMEKPAYLSDLQDGSVGSLGVELITSDGCSCNTWDDMLGDECHIDFAFGNRRRRVLSNRRLMQPPDEGRGIIGLVNEKVFDKETPLFYVYADKIYQIEIEAGTHPYHQHINPFQVLEDVNGGFMAQAGDFRDTCSGDFNMRTYLHDYSGKVILHCHFLPHEDYGMMGWYLMLDPMTENITTYCPLPSADPTAGPSDDPTAVPSVSPTPSEPGSTESTMEEPGTEEPDTTDQDDGSGAKMLSVYGVLVCMLGRLLYA